ncbi:hypothetical protein SARC_10053, partial [Sphaeroforma arctica JP610]
VNTELDCSSQMIYTSVGTRIDDSRLVRDGDALYAALAGEPFMKGVSGPLAATCDTVSTQIIDTDGTNRSGTPMGTRDDWIAFNVGGQVFVTTKTTIQRGESTMLSRLIEEDMWQSTRDRNGTVMLDRSPKYFEPLLNFLRHGEMVLGEGLNPRGVLAEARFFGMNDACKILEQMCKDCHVDAPMNRNSFMDKLMTLQPSDSLRCRGMNFQGTDFSRLDLSNIDFDLCDMRRCIFERSILSGCSFQQAQLCDAVLDGADLSAANFRGAEMQGASMRHCVLLTSSEGPLMAAADMRGVDFDESELSGSVMRAANLRHATMTNCILNHADLAGADLEGAVFSNSTMNQTNFRGANTKDTVFGVMQSPLHMSSFTT